MILPSYSNEIHRIRIKLSKSHSKFRRKVLELHQKKGIFANYFHGPFDFRRSFLSTQLKIAGRLVRVNNLWYNRNEKTRSQYSTLSSNSFRKTWKTKANRHWIEWPRTKKVSRQNRLVIFYPRKYTTTQFFFKRRERKPV